MPYINEDSIKVGCVFKQKNDPAYNGKKIKFSIEKDNQFLVLDSFNLYGSGEYYKETDVLNVEKGDKIFFRIFDDGNEIVKNIDWKCYAYYVNKDTALTDADNKKIYKFESDEDYTATYKTGISPDFSGEINISGSITAPALSDTVILKILKNDIIVYTDTFPYAIAINDSVNFNINADTLDVFKFYFYSNTQVEWSAVHAHLKMSFLQDGKTINIYPNIEYNLFQNDIFPSNPSYLDVDTRIPELYIKFKAQTTHASDLIFSDKDVFYNYEEKIHINQGLSDTLLSIYTYIPENTPIYFDIYTTDKDLANNIEFAKVMLVFYTSDYSNPDTVYYPVGLHTVYSDSMQFLFGNLNRGWGQFAYSPENHSLPIQDSLLKMTDSLILANAFNALSDTNVVHDFPIDTTNMESIESGMGNLGNLITEHGLTLPFNQIFRNMIFDPQSNEWKDVCGLAILSKNKASIGLPSFFDDIDFSELDVPNDSISDEVETLSPEEITMEVPGPYPINVDGKTIRAVNKVTKFNDLSASASIGPTRTSYAAVSATFGTVRQISEFMDMNGDGYPDAIGVKNIQYTTPFRDYEPYKRTMPLLENISFNKTLSLGGTVGSTFPHQGYPKTTKSGFKVRSEGDFGVNGIYGNSRVQTLLIDINGDGLPDYVKLNKKEDDVKVLLNNGYGFEEPISIDIDQITRYESFSDGASSGTSFDIDEHSIGGGLSITVSRDISRMYMADINGDGLVDQIITRDKKLYACVNTGNSFLDEELIISLDNNIENKTYNNSINLAGTLGFSFFGIKAIGNLAGNGGTSVSAVRMQLMDINNDGFLDFVTSDKETELRVHYLRLHEVNLLKRIENPGGSTVEIGYAFSDCSQKAPQRALALRYTKLCDANSYSGCTIIKDYLKSEFEYYNAYYDRETRTSFGFDSVVTTMKNAKWSFRLQPQNFTFLGKKIEKFHTDDYRFKGLKKSEELRDSSNNLLVKTDYTYKLKYISNGQLVEGSGPWCGEVYPALHQEDKYFYEGQANYGIHTQKKYTHTSFGNISVYENIGNVADSSDDIRAEIKYFTNDTLQQKNILSLQDTLKVYAAYSNTLLQKRAAQYDNDGKLKSISSYNGNNISKTEFTYNNYGNIVFVKYPIDANNQQRTLSITYDDTVFTYPVQVMDQSNYKSQTKYNLKFGKPTEITDIAGQKTQYFYAADGRLEIVRAPNEIAANKPYTIKITRSCNLDSGRWTVTRHYNDNYPDIITAQISDMFGRPIQTKKTATIYDVTNGLNVEKTVVSGKIVYDKMGRVISERYPTVENYDTSFIHVFSNVTDTMPPTTTKYDLLSRKTQIITPDSNVSYFEYGFGTDKYNKTCFRTKITDANGKISYIYKNYAGKETTIQDAMNGKTGFMYDVLGQLIQSSDPENNVTSYTYDMLGQLTERTHPDAKTTRYTYDNAGNMMSMQTQKHINAGDTVKYTYQYGRLMQITYPQRPEMNVYYEYGTHEGGTSAGRLVKQQDASGISNYMYGKLGEVIYNSRIFILPNGTVYAMKMNFEYDSWNRIKKITYPDGEVVNYTYHQGGSLKSVSSAMQNMGYDKFGNCVFKHYANNIKALYTYDSLNLRLSNLHSINSQNEDMQNISYTYDNVGNILQQNNTAPQMSNGLGGEYDYTYNYDNLYRLTSSFTGQDSTNNYQMEVDYSPSGRILRNKLDATLIDNGQTIPINRNYNYYYDAYQPHAVTSIKPLSGIKNTQIQYDANGNMTNYVNNLLGGNYPVLTRKMVWDEENRMVATGDDNTLASYIYDAGGERALKFSGQIQSVILDGQPILKFADLNENKSLYMGGYLMVTGSTANKHYYIEGERIKSSVSTNISLSQLDPQGGGLSEHLARYLQMTSINGKTHAEIAEDMAARLRADAILAGCDSILSLPQNFAPFTNQLRRPSIYYYHPDHLGSNSFITDNYGSAIQELRYTPYGEILTNKRSTGSNYNTPYKFSAKEKDQETGFNYFGARYYVDYMYVWLSVDPMSDKYPHQSPYTYCSGNPVMKIDPNGMEDGWYVDEMGSVIGRDKNNDDKLYFVRGNDAAKVKVDNFTKGVSQSKLNDPVEMPNLEQREMLGSLNELGMINKEQEFGMLIYTDNSGNSGGQLYKSETPFNCENGNISGNVNFKNREKLGPPLGSSEANKLKIIAHTHNTPDRIDRGPTSGGDKLSGGASIGIVFGYGSNTNSTYIFNSKTMLRKESKMDTKIFISPFYTPTGKKL